MNSSRAFASLILCTTMLSVAVAGVAQQKNTPSMAPPFTLAGMNGSPVSLASYSGKVVLLDFWATWCVPCQTEVPRFVSMQAKYSKLGFQMIGISMDDSPGPVRKFHARFKMNYPVAMGTPAVASDYGGVLGLPLAFLIARDGRIVKQYDSSADLDQMERDVRQLLEASPQH